MIQVKGLRPDPFSVLVVRMSAIGDVILTTPVISALAQRFPGARIDFFTKRSHADLVRHHPAITEVIEFDPADGLSGLLRAAMDIRRRGYGLVVDLHRNPRSIITRWAGGAYMRRVYRKRTLERLLLKHLRWNLLAGAPAVADRYFTAVEDFGISRNGRSPELYIDRDCEQKAAAVLESRGINKGSGFVALAPGASYETKRWSAESFARAAVELGGEGASVVILGGRGDKVAAGVTAREVSRLGGKAVDLAGELALLQSAAVIACSRILLTNDSGLMHMADALGTPVVAVFGPTARELGFYPLGASARVAEVSGLECRPCTLHGDHACPLGHHRCMTELPVDTVVELGKDALAAGRSE